MRKHLNIAGKTAISDTDNGIYPIFTYQLRNRIKKKMAVNLTVSGEAGVGKSYIAINIGQLLDPTFDIDKQVVFNLKEFMDSILNLKMGKPVVFDEPSYAMGKRDWYKEINKALVLTIESFRFKVHPLIIPIINSNLLDKTIRSYLIQYHLHVLDRGKARVYRISPSQRKDSTYHFHLCDLQYGIFDKNKCDRDSCLDCKKVDNCNLWRAVYERKKSVTQEARYKETLSDARSNNDLQELLQPREIVDKIYENKDMLSFTEKGFVDPVSIKIIVEDVLGFGLSDRKASEYRKRLMIRYPMLDKRNN